MEMAEYEQLSNRVNKARSILCGKYELEYWIEYFTKVVRGEKCVPSRGGSRRFPTPKEVKEARSGLNKYPNKIKALDAEFAEL